MARMLSSRRALLAGAAVLAVPVAASANSAVAQAHPDAELLRLADEFVDLERQLNEMPDTEYGTPEDDAADAATSAMVDRQAEIANVLLGLPPTTTPEGHVAVAQCLTAWTCSSDYPLNGDVTARLTATLLRNMTGRVPQPGWVPPPPPLGGSSPDAGLLALCASYVEAWQERRAHWEAAMAGGEESVRAWYRDNPAFRGRDARSWRQAAEISRTPARTQAGIRAKAQVVRCWLRDCGGEDLRQHMTHPETAAAWSLVCDMLGAETVA